MRLTKVRPERYRSQFVALDDFSAKLPRNHQRYAGFAGVRSPPIVLAAVIRRWAGVAAMPQLPTYCCTALSEVMGHVRSSRPYQRHGDWNSFGAVRGGTP
jgi:hypothetical protein